MIATGQGIRIVWSRPLLELTEDLPNDAGLFPSPAMGKPL